MEFLSLSADVLPHETSPRGNERRERSVFAGWVIEQLLNMSLWFYFSFVCHQVFLSGFSIRSQVGGKSFGLGRDGK